MTVKMTITWEFLHPDSPVQNSANNVWSFLWLTEDKEILRGKNGEIRNWFHQWTYLIMWYQWTMNPFTWVINKAEICRVCLPWCVRHHGEQSQWETKVISSHLPYLSYIDPPLKTLSWCQSSKPGQCLLHTVTAYRTG